MTTSVIVKARAWGANVTVRKVTEGQEGHNVEEGHTHLGPHEDRQFDIGEDETLEVSQGSAPQAEPPVEEEAVDEVMTAQTLDDEDED